ncbi:MAG TPA: hypothetical protein VHN80_19120 [Kineosporiaceae bacterium]|nr:hypothetical protein [Kineosporiaceae bacterium]
MRWLSIVLIAVVNAANAASLVLLVRYLLHGGKADGRTLVYAAIGVWLTNIIVFGLWSGPPVLHAAALLGDRAAGQPGPFGSSCQVLTPSKQDECTATGRYLTFAGRVRVAAESGPRLSGLATFAYRHRWVSGATVLAVLVVVTALDERGVGFRSLRESIDTTTPGGPVSDPLANTPAVDPQAAWAPARSASEAASVTAVPV